VASASCRLKPRRFGSAIESERLLLRDAELLATETRLAGGFERAEEACPDEAHEDEVVEVAGLQSRVLAVVGEAEELARERVEARALAVHPAQRATDQHRGRRASTFCREGGEAVAVARRAGLRVTAAQAEAEAPGHEPRAHSGAEDAGRLDLDGLWSRAAVGPLQPGLSLRVVLEPGVRVFLRLVGIREEVVIWIMQCREPEDLALGVRARLLRRVIVVGAHDRGVVDVAGEQLALDALRDEPDRVVLMPAIPAEMDGIEALLR
jgi:hypothetical protein